MTTARSELVSGVKHVTIAKYASVATNFVIGIMLARLLSPEEYGMVAIVTVFTGFFGLVGSIGIGPGVIQFQTLTEKQIGVLFNITLIAGLVLATFFCGFSYFIASFYKSSTYVLIGISLSVSVLIKSISSVPTALLQRKGEFGIIGKVTIVVGILTGVIGIGLAYTGFSYWSLIIRTVLSLMLTFFCFVYFSRLRFFFSLDSKNLKSVGKFSSYSFLFDFVNYFSRNLDNMLIGKYLGTGTLGIYDRAYSLMKLLLDNFVYSISSVLFPLLARRKDQPDLIYSYHQKMLKFYLITGTFVSVFCFFSSDEIIGILYGEKWARTAAVFRWLGLSLWAQFILSLSGPFFLSSGNSRLQFLTGFLSSVVIMSAIIVGIMYRDVEVLSICLTVAFSLNVFQCYGLLYRYVFKRPFSDFIQMLIRHSFFSFVLFFVLWMVSGVKLPAMYSLALKGVVAGLALFIYLFISGTSKELKSLLVKKEIPVS